MFWTILFIVAVAGYFVLALRRFEDAVLALPLFFPLYLWQVTMKGIPFTLVEAFIYAVLLAWVCRNIFGHFKSVGKGFWHGLKDLFHFKHFHVREADGFPWKYFVPIVLLVAAAVFSTMITLEKAYMFDGVTPFYGRKVALGILKGWIIAPIIMFVLYFVVVKKGKDLLKLLNFYTFSSVILALYGLFQVFTARYVTPDARASGPFESANYLALYIAPAVVYTLIRIKESVVSMADPTKADFLKFHLRQYRKPVEQVDTLAFIGSFLVTFLALLFSKSYAAMLAVLISILVYFGLEYYEFFKAKLKKKFPWKILLIVLGVICLGSLAVFWLDPVKWQNMFNFGARNSSSVRIQVYSISCYLLLTNWFTGIGLGQFPLQYQLASTKVLGGAPYEWNMLHPHNFYVAMWLNLGLVGFLSVLGLIYFMIKEACSYLRNFAWQKIFDLPKIRVVGLALLLVVMVHGIFDTPFFKNDLSLIFWMIAGVMLVPLKDNVTK